MGAYGGKGNKGFQFWIQSQKSKIIKGALNPIDKFATWGQIVRFCPEGGKLKGFEREIPETAWNNDLLENCKDLLTS